MANSSGSCTGLSPSTGRPFQAKAIRADSGKLRYRGFFQRVPGVLRSRLCDLGRVLLFLFPREGGTLILFWVFLSGEPEFKNATRDAQMRKPVVKETFFCTRILDQKGRI